MDVMRQYRSVALVVAVLLCLSFFHVTSIAASADQQSSVNQTDKYRVLFLSSYGMSDEVVQQQIQGLQAALPSGQVDISYEFMDARHSNSDYDLSILYRYLKNKLYRNEKYDCCIAGDDEALSFLLDRTDLIPNTPVVYLSVQDAQLVERANQTGYMTGVMERFEYEANIDALKSLMPDVTTIYYILDNSRVGRCDASNLKSVVAKNPHYAFKILNISELSDAQLDAAIAQADTGSVIFLGDLYFEQDGTVNTYSYKANEIAALAKVPTFNIALNVAGNGVMGGVVYDNVYGARTAGKMAMQIMRGASVDSLATTTTSATVSVFDKHVLDRFGLDVKALPSGATVLNSEPTTLESNWQQLLIAIAVILTLLLIVIVLARRTREQRQLIMTDDELFRQTALEGNDFIALVTLPDKMFVLRSGTFFENGHEVPEESKHTPYESSIKRFANQCLDAATGESFLKDLDIDNIRHMLERNSEVQMSFDFADEDGTQKRKQFNFSWINKASGIILMSRTDITKSLEEEQRRNMELQTAVDAAERANDAKSQFVSRISHDIRTPIGAILNLTDFARADMHDPQQLAHDLDSIATSGRFLLSLINDVLDISKIDSEKIELNPSPYAIDEFISEIHNIIGPMCEEKDLGYTVVTGMIEVPVILIDRVRFNQIMLNLLSNAVKYTPSGGFVHFSAASRRLDDEAEVNIEISDTGIGMSDQFQQVMFNEFSQEEDNPQRVRDAAGTGLGLSIVKRLIDLMNGSIDVESKVGKGTRITIKIPVRIVDADASITEKDGETKPKISRKLSGKVLLAEDNAINASIAKRIFGELGIEIDLAEDGRQELELFEKSDPGEYLAIFTDIQMPVMDGYDATRQIRALDRPDAMGIPIIAMTADAFLDAMEKAREADMSDFITKPLNADEISKILSRIVE